MVALFYIPILSVGIFQVLYIFIHTDMVIIILDILIDAVASHWF